MKNTDTVIGLALSAVTFLAIVVAIIFGVRHCNWVNQCESGGGHVEEYDCYEDTVSTTGVDAGEGPGNVTLRYCSYRCVGASPEAK